MQLIDTICHLDDDRFAPDRDAVMTRARAAGVAAFVVPAILASGWERIAALALAESDVFAAYGLHPQFVAEHSPADLAALDDWVDENPCVALGEIGLDFYASDADRKAQTALFEAQLDIARRRDLPVILHVRKAHDQVIGCLKQASVRGGTVHAYNGSLQQAGQYLDLGFRLGFGGMLTHQRSSKLRSLAQQLPLDGIVLETDAPDLTVASHRGERNSPEYLPECLQALADVRGESPEQVATVTTATARRLFNL